jgi:hypothetical protein
MKRLLFFILMMVCSLSWADWEYTGQTDAFTYYVDKSTIRRNGKIAKMWVLEDFSEAQTNSDDGTKYKSEKSRFAFNCLEETVVSIAITQYSGSMGDGDVIWSNTRKESSWKWGSVVPGSSGEVMFKIACGKK